MGAYRRRRSPGAAWPWAVTFLALAAGCVAPAAPGPAPSDGAPSNPRPDASPSRGTPVRLDRELAESSALFLAATVIGEGTLAVKADLIFPAVDAVDQASGSALVVGTSSGGSRLAFTAFVAQRWEAVQVATPAGVVACCAAVEGAATKTLFAATAPPTWAGGWTRWHGTVAPGETVWVAVIGHGTPRGNVTITDLGTTATLGAWREARGSETALDALPAVHDANTTFVQLQGHGVVRTPAEHAWSAEGRLFYAAVLPDEGTEGAWTARADGRTIEGRLDDATRVIAATAGSAEIAVRYDAKEKAGPNVLILSAPLPPDLIPSALHRFG